ncbi:MAG: branched-chain amino acid ABC transporter permease [Desulfurococcales archaeon]|nr:branched-chain amino acid ABC transporter permease [Desulfurococcales archaeon]
MAAITGIVIQYLIIFSVYTIMALSFNIEYGFGGIPNLGKVLFASLGAYAAGSIIAYTVIKLSAAPLGVEVVSSGEPAYCTGVGKTVMTMSVAKGILSPPELFLLFLAGLVIAAIVGMVAGIVASYPALRLGGDFLAISLLGLGEIVRIWAYNSQWPVCSFNGVSGIPGPFSWMSAHADLAYAILTLAIMIAVFFYVELSTNSPWGRALKAMRDDEIAAEVYGYNVPRVRMQALAVGSALAGLAGALLTFYSGNVNANTYKPDLTFTIIVATLLGGVANNVGVVIGTAVIAGVEIFFNPTSLDALGLALPENVALAIPYMKYVIMGLIIVLILLYRPQGIMPERPLKVPIVELAKKRARQSKG